MVSHVLSILGGPIERRVRDLQTVPRWRWIVSWQHVNSQRTLTAEEGSLEKVILLQSAIGILDDLVPVATEPPEDAPTSRRLLAIQ